MVAAGPKPPPHPTPHRAPEKTQGEKAQVTGTRRTEMYIKGKISVSLQTLASFHGMKKH